MRISSDPSMAGQLFPSRSLTLSCPVFPAPVQRAVLQGNPSQHDTRDRESEEEPGAAEYGKLSLFSLILSHISYSYSSQHSENLWAPCIVMVLSQAPVGERELGPSHGSVGNLGLFYYNLDIFVYLKSLQ